MPKIIVVSLDMRIDLDSLNFSLDSLEKSINYSQKSASCKIDYLVSRMQSICDTLKKTNPDDNWIFAWREYGITGAVNREIDSTDKQKFKNSMKKITKHYSNLTVIGGTISTKKMGISKDQVENILKYYDELKDVDEYKKLAKDAIIIADKKPEITIQSIRNTAYIFQDGELIQRIDKMAPYNELEAIEKKANIFAIFKPGGKEKNNNHFIKIPYYKQKNSFFDVAVDICYEHNVGLSKSMGETSGKKQALIHLVLSASINLNQQHFYGKFIIHHDSVSAPSITVTDAKVDQVVELRSNNAYDNSPALQLIPLLNTFESNLIKKSDVDLEDHVEQPKIFKHK